ncbi:anti-sigma F factor [Salimicrobium halophilum]|uniref:Anti-sigma F factor n=1 Tax=Salimicrobium halophilum TaxID=86666 RepID=A0A1G8PXG1_9BACI|nr:anti-sigma F factor [Salimicrobium halophilum]SDI97123.1 stage II sporulation protein AB (anti-sigma F factor) [Salimicrobium halophilum]
MKNRMTLTFDSRSENESLARVTVSGFMAPLDPTMEEMMDVKTVVSEAVTNAIIHGYDSEDGKDIELHCAYENDELVIVISDNGSGIEDVEMAKEPLYTSKPELERSGMGFTIMENFMDHVLVTSSPGNGTRVELRKKMVAKDRVCH